MSKWVCVAAIADLPLQQVITIQVQETSLLIYATEDGYYVYPDRCTHEDVPLSDGYLVKGTIVCRLHGAKFDLTSGHCLRAPAIKNLQGYAVAVRNEHLWVNLAQTIAQPMAMEKLPTVTIRSYRTERAVASILEKQS